MYPLELEYQRSEMQPQFANIATPSEMVVTTSFTLEIGDTTGTIHLCFPYSTLEPIRDVLYSTMQGDANEPDRRWVNLLKTADPVGRGRAGGRRWPPRRPRWSSCCPSSPATSSSSTWTR